MNREMDEKGTRIGAGELEDARLLAAIARGERTAFAVFYERHLPVVLGVLLRETGDPELTADLAAEVFASVLLAAARYRAQYASALPWVLGIARNVLGASRRRERVEDRARRQLGLTPIGLDDEDLERVRAVADSERSRVVALLNALPAAEREAVEARIVREQSYPEIAGALRCSEMVVRKRVSRGLARIRAQLGERR